MADRNHLSNFGGFITTGAGISEESFNTNVDISQLKCNIYDLA